MSAAELFLEAEPMASCAGPQRGCHFTIVHKRALPAAISIGRGFTKLPERVEIQVPRKHIDTIVVMLRIRHAWCRRYANRVRVRLNVERSPVGLCRARQRPECHGKRQHP
jgi:hypothetical protein